MKNALKTLAIGVLLGSAPHINAQTVTVDPALLTLGYMNWQPMPGVVPPYGGSGGGPWGVADLRSSFAGTTLTLQPNVNTYSAGNNYWVNADGSGANRMDANLYNETTGTYVNTTLQFTFDVVANTLTGPYSSQAFIKDFAPNYSSFTQSTVPLTAGVETVSLMTSANAGDHIQYGFETFGPDTDPNSSAAAESVVITPAPVPEPASIALAGLGGIAVLGSFLRRRK